jgi:hypothetical protein
VKKKSSSRIRSAIDRVSLRTATRMVRIVRSLEKTFPKRYVKPIAGILTGLVVIPVLLLIVTLLLVPVLIWDLFDPFGIWVHWVVYLFFLFLYASAGYLSYILILDVVDIVEMIYHPVNYLLKKTASTLMMPLTNILKKATLFLAITLGVIELIFALVMVAFGFSCALLLVMAVLVLVFLAMVLIGKGITMIVRWFLNLVFRSIFGSIDRRFKISEKANRYGERIDRQIELQNELKRRG